MIPVKPEARDGAHFVVFAKDQPEYLPLPANISHPHVETKWKLTWRERLHVLLRGNLYLTLMTFGHPLQPIRLSIMRDDIIGGDPYPECRIHPLNPHVLFHRFTSLFRRAA